MKFLITAGPTREPIDPVRFLSNRSSGRMGYALAEAALEAGHGVTLISGPVCLTPPAQAETVRVTTAEEMYEAVQTRMDTGCDVLVMCAAVADFKPREVRAQKIKKEEGFAKMELVPTRDILASLQFSKLNERRALIVGFAAETQALEENALRKLRAKQCDLICANDVTRMDTGFDADENELVLFFREGARRVLPRATKRELARELVKICVALAEKR